MNTLNTVITYVFVVVVGLRGALAVVRQRTRTGAYAALPPIEGTRAVVLGASNVIGVAAVLIANLFTLWPPVVRGVLLWGGFVLILVMETIGVVWARQQKGDEE